MNLKAAVIGLGNISGAHISQWQKQEGVDLVAGADVNEEAVAQAVQAHGLRGYTDWKKMLDEEQPDLLSICTPPFLHRTMTVEALERGIHVICEKPMATHLAEAEIMAAVAETEKLKAKLMIAYCHRFHGPVMKTKELLDSGILGKPVFFRGCFAGMVDFSKDHRGNLHQSGGGCLMDNGSHAADIYQYLFGKIANVCCRVGTFLQNMETEDVGAMLFEGENGCLGEIVTGYSLPAEFDQWQIAGEKGILELPEYWSGPVRFRAHDSKEWQTFEADNSETRFDRQFRHFLECVREDKQPLASAESALHITRVLTAAYKDAHLRGVAVSG